VKVRANHWRFAIGHRLRIRLSGAPSALLVPLVEPVVIELLTGPGATLRLPGFAAPDPDV
jgi:hypothetical protein